MQSVIKRTLKSDIKHRYKVDAAFKFCKKMISTFKTEERRRVRPSVLHVIAYIHI